MRIISKTYDYYDGGATYGIDKSILYLRKREEIEMKNRIILGDFKLIGFCGEIYLFSIKGEGKKKVVLFGKDAVSNEIEEYTGYNNETLYRTVERNKGYYHHIHSKRYDELKNDSFIKSLFLTYKTPVFLIDLKRNPLLFLG